MESVCVQISEYGELFMPVDYLSRGAAGGGGGGVVMGGCGIDGGVGASLPLTLI